MTSHILWKIKNETTNQISLYNQWSQTTRINEGIVSNNPLRKNDEIKPTALDIWDSVTHKVGTSLWTRAMDQSG